MREPETTKFGVCEELGIGLVAWGPLGQGFLTGGITRDMRFDNPDDLRADFPRFTPEALEANFALVDFLKHFGAERALPRLRSHSPGCWPRNPGSYRSPVAPASHTWMITSPQPISNSARTTSGKSMKPSPPSTSSVHRSRPALTPRSTATANPDCPAIPGQRPMGGTPHGAAPARWR